MKTRKTSRISAISVAAAASACLVLAVMASQGGCDATDPAGEERVLPEGTVLVLDGEPITAAEVDAHIAALATIMPAYTDMHRRRQMLTNVIFPLAYGRANHSAAREEVRAEADAWYATHIEGGEAFDPGEERIGNWDFLGVDLWLVLRELDEGEWSAVSELPGRFVVAQVLERDPTVRGGREMFRVNVIEFPYVEHPGALITELLGGKLEVIDPAWHEIVPGLWEYGMDGESR